MKTLKNVIALFLVLVMVSSCMENEEYTSTQQQQNQQNQQDITAPTGNAVEFEESEDLSKTDDSSEESALIEESKDGPGLENRSGVQITSNFGTGGYGNAILKCGNRIKSSTIGKSNRYGNDFYNKLGFSTNLNGGDAQFYVELTQDQLLRFDLTKTNKNMAMSLFRGNWVCEYRNGIYYVVERFDELVAYSSSHSTYEEHLGPLSLTAGKYLLIIDSAPGNGSNFDLHINCQSNFVSCNGSNTGLIFDNFQSYNLGNVSQQSYLWEKWNANSFYDGEVGMSGGNKYLKIERKINTSAQNQPDVLLNIGERGFNERIKVGFKMYIYGGKTAHFNIQKFIATEWGGQVYFSGNGQGQVKLSNRTLNFSYTQNAWMNIELDINMRNNQTVLLINGVVKAVWTAKESSKTLNGSMRFEAINFYPYATNSQFFIDDVCVSKL